MIFGTAYAIVITLYTVPIQGHPHPAPPLTVCTESHGVRECERVQDGRSGTGEQNHVPH